MASWSSRSRSRLRAFLRSVSSQAESERCSSDLLSVMRRDAITLTGTTVMDAYAHASVAREAGLHSPFDPEFHFGWDRITGKPTATVCGVCEKLVTVLGVPGERYPAGRLVAELEAHYVEEFMREGELWTSYLSA